MKRTFLLLSLCFFVLSGCAPSRQQIIERQEKSRYINRLGRDFWPTVHYCVVYIGSPLAASRVKTYQAADHPVPIEVIKIVTGGGLVQIALESSLPKEDLQFERQINDYLKGGEWSIDDYLVKLFEEKPFLPLDTKIEYVKGSSADQSQTEWKESDAYVVIAVAPTMWSKGGWGSAQLPLTLNAGITIIPKGSMDKWEGIHANLKDEIEKNQNIQEITKTIKAAELEFKNLNIYRESFSINTPFFDKKTWISNDGKFLKERFEEALRSLAETIRQKISSIK
jgi:hypothetical protein